MTGPGPHFVEMTYGRYN